MSTETRPYQSALRRDQAEATKARVLDGLVRVIASDGVAELSMPAVAKEAGVSVPTIYRHFGSKQGLVSALGEYVAAKARLGFDEFDTPATVDEFVEMIEEFHFRGSRMDPALRAAMATGVGQDARRATMPRRLKAVEESLSLVARGVAGDDFERLRDIILILGSSATTRAFSDYLGMDSDEAGRTVGWAVRLLLEALTSDRSLRRDQ
jgi:AcrR family transcriptional regulator